MKGKVVVLSVVFLFVAALAFLTGCGREESRVQSAPEEKVTVAAKQDGGKGAEEVAKQQQEKVVQGSLTAVVDHFKKEGLAVSDVHQKAYERIGAAAGIGLTVEGGGIEIYQFDPATASEAIVKSLEKARTTGKFLDPNINREVPVAIKGNIMIVGLEIGGYKHPAKDRVVEVFNKF